MSNAYMRNGKYLISRVQVIDNIDLKDTIRNAVDKIGGLKKTISPGDTVIIKPNFNSDDLFPASTDPEFLKCVIELCRESGASKIKIIESSGFPWLPTQRVFDKLGITSLAKKYDADLLALDHTDIVELQQEGMRQITKADMYKAAFEDGAKLLWLPCMKTHSYSRFSLSLKLIIGLLDIRKRQWLHSDADKLETKIAELNKFITPHLIIMDARKAFSSGGPAQGNVIEPKTILASGDRIAMDVEALRILQDYKDNNLLTKQNIWDYDQIKTAAGLGIGARNDDEIEIV